MDHIHVTLKRFSLYVFGLFFLSLGVSFSIKADFGVSPVSSLAYAFSLTTGFSVGAMTFVANLLFIVMQVIFSKRFLLRESIVQLAIAFIFGLFMDLTLFLVQLLPFPEILSIRILYLIISLFIAAIGLFGYVSAKFPLMPYDELTYVISERFRLKFSNAKITSDLLNVTLAGVICLTFIQSFGSIGIGTVIAAYFIGKILGFLMKHLNAPIKDWIYEENRSQKENEVHKKTRNLVNERHVRKVTNKRSINESERMF